MSFPYGRAFVALAFLGLVLLAPRMAMAVQPDEIMADASLEARARHLSAELRCMVCQNESIDDSNAELARDLRILVRERLQAGDSDEQILAFLIQRYGDFILLRPPLKVTTWLLWGAPFLILVAGAAGVILAARRRRTRFEDTRILTDSERAKLKALLEDDGA